MNKEKLKKQILKKIIIIKLKDKIDFFKIGTCNNQVRKTKSQATPPKTC